MLVGEPPHSGITPQAVLAKIITGEAKSVTGQRRSVPLNVDGAIAKAIEKLPADRFGSAKSSPGLSRTRASVTGSGTFTVVSLES
jgi:serine/threonine-protein kinase